MFFKNKNSDLNLKCFKCYGNMDNLDDHANIDNNLDDNESDSDDSSDVTSFRRQSNHTSPDFRVDLSLRSIEMKDLQILCLVAKSEVQFRETMLMLLLLFKVFKHNAELVDDISSVSSLSISSNHDNNSMDLSELSVTSVLDDFLDEDENDFFANNMEITKHDQFLAIIATYLCCSILDIDAFIIATIDVTVVRRGEWEDVESTTRSERINRRIDDFGNTCFYHNTRLQRMN